VALSPDNGLEALSAFRQSIGSRRPGIWSLWSDWGGGNAPFPDAAFLDAIVAKGGIPMLFWQPVDPTNLADSRYAYSAIAAGLHDAYLRSWAQAAKAWGGTILAKFAQEMNGAWFPWSIGRFDNTSGTFVAAWRHIVDVVRSEGATNVRFVWAPFAPCHGCASFGSLYPGDAYVDYAGFSVFDWGGNVSLPDLLRKPVNDIAAITSRPIVVAETGTPANDRKATWIRDGYPAVYEQYPQVRAIVYFDVKVFGQPDWRLDQPSAAIKAYKRLYRDPRFSPLLG
jgi:hypothetical protein